MSNIDGQNLSGRLQSCLAEIQHMLRDDGPLPGNGFFDSVGLRIEADRKRYAAHFAASTMRPNSDA